MLLWTDLSISVLALVSIVSSPHGACECNNGEGSRKGRRGKDSARVVLFAAIFCSTIGFHGIAPVDRFIWSCQIVTCTVDMNMLWLVFGHRWKSAGLFSTQS